MLVLMSPYVYDFAVASQPYPSGHITADKREIFDFPKLPSATSFMLGTLGAIAIKEALMRLNAVFLNL